MTAVGGHVTRKRGQVCVVPKLSRVTSSVQTLLPREKKSPIAIIELGSLERCPPQSKGGDRHMYQMGVILSSQTNCHFCVESVAKFLIFNL